MKKNYLKLSGNQSNFHSLALKLKNLSNKIDELINSGKFWEFSKKEQDRLVSKLRRIFEKLSNFNPSYALKIAGAALCFGFISNNAKASAFNEWPVNPIDGISGDFIDGAFADIDNDGYLDALLLTTGGDIKYYKNINGTYTENSADNPFNSGYYGTGIDIADLDGVDGLDAITITSGYLSHYRLNSSGKFTEYSSDWINYQNSGTGAYLGGNKAKFGDVNDDGDLDIVGLTSSTLVSLIQSGANTFYHSWDLPVSGTISGTSYQSHIIIENMDGDDDDDIFIFTPQDGEASPGALNDATSNILYFENEGSGTFNPNSTDIPLPLSQMSDTDFPLLADLDGDGDIDIFTPNAPDENSNLQNGAASAVPVSPLIALGLFAAGGFGIFRKNRKKNKA